MTKPTVVLLHGWGGSFASTFVANGWLDALSAVGRRSMPLDLPGHGGGGTQNPADYADLAGSVAQRLPAGEIDVIGYSLGAKLALDIAERFPGRFRRIVAIGVGNNAFAPEASGEAVACALEQGLRSDSPAGIRALVEYSKAGRGDPAVLAAVLRRPPNPVIDPAKLTTLGSRTLLVNGTDDHLAMPDDKLRAALPGLTYVQLTGVGHVCLPADEPVRRSAVAFLEAQSGE